jgi:hypothetical protein
MMLASVGANGNMEQPAAATVSCILKDTYRARDVCLSTIIPLSLDHS